MDIIVIVGAVLFMAAVVTFVVGGAVWTAHHGTRNYKPEPLLGVYAPEESHEKDR